MQRREIGDTVWNAILRPTSALRPSTILRPIEIVVRGVERELAGPEDDHADDALILAAALRRTAAAIDRHARALERLATTLAPVPELTDALERSTAMATALREALLVSNPDGNGTGTGATAELHQTLTAGV